MCIWLRGTLGQFPIIGDQLTVQPLTGHVGALVIGVVISLLAGLGVMGAAQNAFNRISAVPFKSRPNFLFGRLRSIGMLGILGTLVLAATVVGGFIGAGSHSARTVVIGVVLAFVLNLAVFMIAFKLLTAADPNGSGLTQLEATTRVCCTDESCLRDPWHPWHRTARRSWSSPR